MLRVPRHSLCVLLALAALVSAGAAVRADVKLAPVFGNGMVLQRGMAVPIWGAAAEGEQVTVAFLDQKKTATAGKDGKWSIKLDELKAGGPYKLSVSGKNSLELDDVLVGEVWVCSGQSNMEMTLQGCENADKEIASADYPLLRHNRGSWQTCSPKTAGGFSAAAYYFGRDLHKALNVPVGLIHRSVGGTSARSWTSVAAIEKEEGLKPYLDDIKKQNPGNLYEQHIRPVVGYAARGFIWYQGESDAGRPEEYRKLFPTLIRSWRSDWGQGDMPFLFVQLAPIGGPPKDANGDAGWAPVREAQASALSLPKTGMAVIIDSDADIHPKKKQLPGERLALAARAVAYNEKLVASGPTFDSMTVAGDRATLSFKNVGGGLKVNGDQLKGFAVAGEDGKYFWAETKVEADKVVVWSKDVPKPTAVRYGWSSNPQCNLYNKEGLPASPFRTDAPAAN